MLVLAATCGSLLGESGVYLVGRRFGARIRTGRPGRCLGEDNWSRADRFLTGRGGSALIAARYAAVAHALVPVVAGTLRMARRRRTVTADRTAPVAGVQVRLSRRFEDGRAA